jgi:hypothetical protein
MVCAASQLRQGLRVRDLLRRKFRIEARIVPEHIFVSVSRAKNENTYTHIALRVLCLADPRQRV